MQLIIEWIPAPEGQIAVAFRWESHKACLEANDYESLAKMVGQAILGCLDEEDAEKIVRT